MNAEHIDISKDTRNEFIRNFEELRAFILNAPTVNNTEAEPMRNINFDSLNMISGNTNALNISPSERRRAPIFKIINETY